MIARRRGDENYYRPELVADVADGSRGITEEHAGKGVFVDKWEPTVLIL